jgi:hypothetical protein
VLLYRVCLKGRQKVEVVLWSERRERPEGGWWVWRGPNAGPAWRCWLVGSVAPSPEGPPRHSAIPRVALLDEQRKPLLSGVFFSSVFLERSFSPGDWARPLGRVGFAVSNVRVILLLSCSVQWGQLDPGQLDSVILLRVAPEPFGSGLSSSFCTCCNAEGGCPRHRVSMQSNCSTRGFPTRDKALFDTFQSTYVRIN